ncbi:MAG: pentapeptide repeat-containing protein, partial [Desulfobacterales bacterium]
VFADIRETDVSTKPPNFWRIENEQDRIDSVKGAFLKNKDLRYADMFRAFLPKAILRRADLEGARLTKANFEGADMREANFENASLSMANLKNTDLRQAKLMNADLIGADLQNANLGLAHLQGADFREADLQNADLRCANLAGAKNLDTEILGPAKTLYKAILDSELHNQIEMELPHLFEKPEDQWLELNLREACEEVPESSSKM